MKRSTESAEKFSEPFPLSRWPLSKKRKGPQDDSRLPWSLCPMMGELCSGSQLNFRETARLFSLLCVGLGRPCNGHLMTSRQRKGVLFAGFLSKRMCANTRRLREKKAHKHKLFALVNVQTALGQTAGCPRVNRAKKFMCSPRNTGNINFFPLVNRRVVPWCPGFRKVYVFKVYVPFACPTERNSGESCFVREAQRSTKSFVRRIRVPEPPERANIEDNCTKSVLAVGAYVSWFLSPKRIMRNHLGSCRIM